jgi:hypothetical protein
MVVDFMEGVLWGIVQVAEMAGSEEVAEEAAGGDASDSEKRKAKGKKEGERVDEEEVENRSGFRAGARRTQLPADGIDTRITPSSGLSAGPILASHPTFSLAGSPDTNTVHRSNAAEIYHSEDEMEQAFGPNFGFPTNRRPVDYRRPLISPVSEDAEAWLEASGITIGELPQPQGDQALQLLWMWKDIFCHELATLPATDLIYHSSPSRRYCKPVRSNRRLSTAEEVAWLQEHITAMEKAGVIDRIDSPWSAPSRFVRKKNNSLRLTHTYCPMPRSSRTIQCDEWSQSSIISCSRGF